MAELNIVLVEPEIPQNTGNIARTCAISSERLSTSRQRRVRTSEHRKAVQKESQQYVAHI